jgi:hypothetical protein
VLIFIDSDMIWDAATLAKLIDSPFDVAVANYRKRNNEVTWLASPVMDKGQPRGTMYGGDIWLQTIAAGTGMMAIKRHMLDAMIDRYPGLNYEDNGEVFPCLFDFQLSAGQYCGEDYTFCKRVTDMGGQIFILADAYIGHVGTTVYGGNYHEFLQGKV